MKNKKKVNQTLRSTKELKPEKPKISTKGVKISPKITLWRLLTTLTIQILTKTIQSSPSPTPSITNLTSPPRVPTSTQTTPLAPRKMETIENRKIYISSSDIFSRKVQATSKFPYQFNPKFSFQGNRTGDYAILPYTNVKNFSNFRPTYDFSTYTFLFKNAAGMLAYSPSLRSYVYCGSYRAPTVNNISIAAITRGLECWRPFKEGTYYFQICSNVGMRGKLTTLQLLTLFIPYSSYLNKRLTNLKIPDGWKDSPVDYDYNNIEMNCAEDLCVVYLANSTLNSLVFINLDLDFNHINVGSFFQDFENPSFADGFVLVTILGLRKTLNPANTLDNHFYFCYMLFRSQTQIVVRGVYLEVKVEGGASKAYLGPSFPLYSENYDPKIHYQLIVIKTQILFLKLHKETNALRIRCYRVPSSHLYQFPISPNPGPRITLTHIIKTTVDAGVTKALKTISWGYDDAIYNINFSDSEKLIFQIKVDDAFKMILLNDGQGAIAALVTQSGSLSMYSDHLVIRYPDRLGFVLEGKSRNSSASDILLTMNCSVGNIGRRYKYTVYGIGDPLDYIEAYPYGVNHTEVYHLDSFSGNHTFENFFNLRNRVIDGNFIRLKDFQVFENGKQLEKNTENSKKLKNSKNLKIGEKSFLANFGKIKTKAWVQQLRYINQQFVFSMYHGENFKLTQIYSFRRILILEYTETGSTHDSEIPPNKVFDIYSVDPTNLKSPFAWMKTHRLSLPNMVFKGVDYVDESRAGIFALKYTDSSHKFFYADLLLADNMFFFFLNISEINNPFNSVKRDLDLKFFGYVDLIIRRLQNMEDISVFVMTKKEIHELSYTEGLTLQYKKNHTLEGLLSTNVKFLTGFLKFETGLYVVYYSEKYNQRALSSLKDQHLVLATVPGNTSDFITIRHAEIFIMDWSASIFYSVKARGTRMVYFDLERLIGADSGFSVKKVRCLKGLENCIICLKNEASGKAKDVVVAITESFRGNRRGIAVFDVTHVGDLVMNFEGFLMSVEREVGGGYLFRLIFTDELALKVQVEVSQVDGVLEGKNQICDHSDNKDGSPDTSGCSRSTEGGENGVQTAENLILSNLTFLLNFENHNNRTATLALNLNYKPSNQTVNLTGNPFFDKTDPICYIEDLVKIQGNIHQISLKSRTNSSEEALGNLVLPPVFSLQQTSDYFDTKFGFQKVIVSEENNEIYGFYYTDQEVSEIYIYHLDTLSFIRTFLVKKRLTEPIFMTNLQDSRYLLLANIKSMDTLQESILINYFDGSKYISEEFELAYFFGVKNFFLASNGLSRKLIVFDTSSFYVYQAVRDEIYAFMSLAMEVDTTSQYVDIASTADLAKPFGEAELKILVFYITRSERSKLQYRAYTNEGHFYYNQTVFTGNISVEAVNHGTKSLKCKEVDLGLEIHFVRCVLVPMSSKTIMVYDIPLLKADREGLVIGEVNVRRLELPPSADVNITDFSENYFYAIIVNNSPMGSLPGYCDAGMNPLNADSGFEEVYFGKNGKNAFFAKSENFGFRGDFEAKFGNESLNNGAERHRNLGDAPEDSGISQKLDYMPSRVKLLIYKFDDQSLFYCHNYIYFNAQNNKIGEIIALKNDQFLVNTNNPIFPLRKYQTLYNRPIASTNPSTQLFIKKWADLQNFDFFVNNKKYDLYSIVYNQARREREQQERSRERQIFILWSVGILIIFAITIFICAIMCNRCLVKGSRGLKGGVSVMGRGEYEKVSEMKELNSLSAIGDLSKFEVSESYLEESSGITNTLL